MAKRKRRRTTKRKTPAKKRTTHRRKRRRANPSNPRRRRASHRRRTRSNPRRRARRAHAVSRRSSRRNPSRRRSSHRRRRNPGGPLVSALIALGLGAAAFVATDVITFYATSDMAKDGQRNRKILAVLGAGAGLYLATKKPLIGLGIAVGSLLAGFGNAIDLFVLRMLPAKASGGALAPGASGIGAVAYDNMQAVAYDNMQALQYEGAPRLGMGAVQFDNMQGWETMGNPIPPPPWDSESPFSDQSADY